MAEESNKENNSVIDFGGRYIILILYNYLL